MSRPVSVASDSIRRTFRPPGVARRLARAAFSASRLTSHPTASATGQSARRSPSTVPDPHIRSMKWSSGQGCVRSTTAAATVAFRAPGWLATRQGLVESGRGEIRTSASQPSPPRSEGRTRISSSPSSGSWRRPAWASSSAASRRRAALSRPAGPKRKDSNVPRGCSERTTSIRRSSSRRLWCPRSAPALRPRKLSARYAACAVRRLSRSAGEPWNVKRRLARPESVSWPTRPRWHRLSSRARKASRPGTTSHSTSHASTLTARRTRASGSSARPSASSIWVASSSIPHPGILPERRRQQVTSIRFRKMSQCPAEAPGARHDASVPVCWHGGFFMARPEKVEQVELLTEKLRNARVAVLTDYRGLTVSQLQDLRGRLRAQEIEYRVVKNTLARRAAVEAGHGEFSDLLKGPVAIAFGYGDVGAPARVLGEFTRQTRIRLEIVGGLVEGRVLGGDQARQTADLPTREVLLAQLLGTIQSPAAQLVATIQAPLQQMIGVLEAYKEKMEGGPQAA